MIDIAQRIVDQALKLGADEAEVFISNSQGRGFTIEKNSISSLSGGVENGMGIRVIKDKKLGFAYCTEEKKAEDAINRALSLSKLSKESEFTFADPGKIQKIENTFDKRIEDYQAEEALQGAMDIIAEKIAHDIDNRKLIKKYILNNANIH